MSSEQLSTYITHLPEFKVVVCRFCKWCIIPGDPLRHYESNHTAKKAHFVPVKIRHKIRDYMIMLDLCEPDKMISPNRLIPELRIINKGYICSFPDCRACGTSEKSMHTHYYAHQASIPKDFKNWEKTRLQTFFEGSHRK
jgi:hypothetical protein